MMMAMTRYFFVCFILTRVVRVTCSNPRPNKTIKRSNVSGRRRRSRGEMRAFIKKRKPKKDRLILKEKHR